MTQANLPPENSARFNDMKSPGPDQLRKQAISVRQEKANRWAADLAPILTEIQAGGATSLGQIADTLNARGIPAAKGGLWSRTQVMRLLDRLDFRVPAR